MTNYIPPLVIYVILVTSTDMMRDPAAHIKHSINYIRYLTDDCVFYIGDDKPLAKHTGGRSSLKRKG